jgi:DNA-binding response OmpR family regulator
MQYCPQKHVLCVDDDLDNCEIVAVVLPEISLMFAHTFADGMALIRSRLFDLYLLDNWLLDGSGVDLCREIRRTDANTPIVFLSAAAYARDHEAAMEAGASAYLDKPLGMLQLESTVARLIQEAESRSLDARLAEITAVRAAVEEHIAKVNARTEEYAKKSIRANEHLLRATAYSAFLDSGGIRAEFERLWPGLLSEMT